MMGKRAFSKALISLLDTSSEGLWFMDENNFVQFYNTAFYEQFDMPLVNSKFADWLALVHPDDRHLLSTRVNEHQSDAINSKRKTRYRVKNRKGQYLWVEGTGMLIEHENTTMLVGTHKNVSDEVFFNQYLAHTASHDAETGLQNRHKFSLDIPSLNNTGWIIVCCFTQLQHFQRRLGHNAISTLSSTLVTVLDGAFPQDYQLYRINADTFVVSVASPFTSSEVNILLGLVKKEFQNQRPPHIDYESNFISLSAIPSSDLDRSNPLKEIFSLSEYSREVNPLAVNEGKLRQDITRYFYLQDALGDAIISRQLSVALQPIVDASTGDIISYEALARWEHPTLGFISPAEFIPMAEKLGHIHALGILILDQACQFLSSLDNTQQSLINVNISALQLAKHNFVEDALRVIRNHALQPSSIVLEITESYLLESTTTIVNTLHMLNQLGFKLSIDDFGAGMTAITSLFRLPLYQIKLDMELVKEAMKIRGCLRFVETICEYGREYEIVIVAEGVETDLMYETLKQIGIQYLQGYYICKPCQPKVFL